MDSVEHTLSWRSIFRVILAACVIYLVINLFKIILLILISMMLASALYPLVVQLRKFLPLTVAAILAIVILFLPVVFLALTIIPTLVSQFPEILKALNSAVDNSTLLPPALRNVDFSSYAQNVGSYLLKSTSVITGVITTFFTIVFLTLYFMIDSNRLHKVFLSFAPDEYEGKLQKLIEELARINGQYIRGNFIISIICGIIIYLGLLALDVPYASSLAVFAAVVDMLPLVGAFIGVIPAAIMGFSVSPQVGIFVLILFAAYQQFENNIISPNVYNKALDISPALSFIAVIIGATLFGILGAFIALPIAASIPTIVRYISFKE